MQGAKDLEVFPSVSVSHQLEAAPGKHELPRMSGAGAEQTPGAKECPPAKNHKC